MTNSFAPWKVCICPRDQLRFDVKVSDVPLLLSFSVVDVLIPVQNPHSDYKLITECTIFFARFVLQSLNSRFFSHFDSTYMYMYATSTVPVLLLCWDATPFNIWIDKTFYLWTVSKFLVSTSADESNNLCSLSLSTALFVLDKLLVYLK